MNFYKLKLIAHRGNPIPRVAFQKIERKRKRNRKRKRKHHLRLRCQLRLRLVNFVTKGGPYEFLNQFKACGPPFDLKLPNFYPDCV